MSLWNFALALYARPGVEQACLAAQDEGADVCLLLCGAWLDSRGVIFRPDRADQLQRVALERQVSLIGPLRSARRQLREAAQREPQLAQLRDQIKGMELAAERQLLEQLEQLSQDWEGSQASDPGEWLQALGAPLPAQHQSLELIQRQRLALGQAQ